ncbi:MAG: GNAT family N-acetyltransferase [Solirubrobacteraceae bacterium]
MLAVSAAVGRPLRMAVLRPHEPADRAMYRAEEDPATLHVAAIRGEDEVLAVGSVMPDPYPGSPQPGDWRVRGMATRPDLRGTGLGALVLARCEQHARGEGGLRLWCNARVGARRFYEHAGLVAEGEVFELPGIGPHVLMSKRLA